MPNWGQNGYAQGAISDQTQLLQDIRNGLAVYNQTIDPVVDTLSEQTIRQTLRVSQAPKTFMLKPDKGRTPSVNQVYRLLTVPFKTYALSTDFSVEWLQDALDSDIMGEMSSAMAGDAELVNSLFYQAIFTKKTVGAVGTAYQAGFYNGELDVPPYKNASFASAHYHYIGLNTTTLTQAHLQSMKLDVQEHGYGLVPGSLHLFCSTTEAKAIANLANTNASSTVLQAATPNRVIAIDSGVVGSGYTYDGMVVHVDDNVPVGYLALVASDVKPVAMRNHFKPEYQGLQIYTDEPIPEYPLAGQSFVRRVGFAVQHLGAGTCRQLVGSTTYTNPTFRIPAGP